MTRYSGGWAPYVPVAERRRKAEREMEKLRKKGAVVSPVRIEGRQIARSAWGKAWCDNLESYRDYENRLPRGRTYVRNGSVVDLQITSREVTAMVSGSAIYKVKVSIGEVAKARWEAICADCSGGIESLVELLQGRFSKGVMERLCRQNTGLFPRPSEIRFTCSCPDFASMCKHVAAVLYGVGAMLDEKPELLFRLRAVDETDLLPDLGNVLPDALGERDGAKTLAGDDLAALFGLEMTEVGVKKSERPRVIALAGPSNKSGMGAAKQCKMVAKHSATAAVRKAKQRSPAQQAIPVGQEKKRVEVASTKTTARKSAPKGAVARTSATPQKPSTTLEKCKSRIGSAAATTANRQNSAKAPTPARSRPVSPLSREPPGQQERPASVSVRPKARPPKSRQI